MDAEAIVKADALFEAALGVALIAATAAGGLGAGDFPAPVGKPVLVVVGCALLAVAVVLFRGRVSLIALAAANLVTAFAALVAVTAAAGFSTAGATIVLVTTAVLVSLAVAQLGLRARLRT